MKFKNLSTFYKIYFSALIVFAVLLLAGAVALNVWLGEYNKGIPETVSEQFFTNNFVELNVDNIIAMSGITPSEFETYDDLKRHLENELDKDDLSYTSISTGSDDGTKKYIIKSGEYKIASFTLKADEKNDYHPHGLELHLPHSAVKEFKILDTSTLSVNGVKVSEKYISRTEDHISTKLLPDGVKAPKWVVYAIPGLTKEPETQITDRNGNNPQFIEVSGALCEDIIYDEPESEVVDRLVLAAKQYAICMQNDASKASVTKYLKKGTDLYSSFMSAENMFVWNHSGYSFENEEVSEFFRYDENTVSCRISFTHCLHKAGYEDYKDHTDITYFATNESGEYLIFARYNN